MNPIVLVAEDDSALSRLRRAFGALLNEMWARDPEELLAKINVSRQVPVFFTRGDVRSVKSKVGTNAERVISLSERMLMIQYYLILSSLHKRLGEIYKAELPQEQLAGLDASIALRLVTALQEEIALTKLRMTSLVISTTMAILCMADLIWAKYNGSYLLHPFFDLLILGGALLSIFIVIRAIRRDRISQQP